MNIHRVDLAGCGSEADTVVVIDVLRAFTTAAMAFSRGTERIFPAATIAEAFSLKRLYPGAVTIGEDGGKPIRGFDHPNSPSILEHLDLQGKTIIQRTSNGTQGITRSLNARAVLAASLCCASATVMRIKSLAPQSVTLVETGRYPGGYGAEDTACADVIEQKLHGKEADIPSTLEKAGNSRTAAPFFDPDDMNHPNRDLQHALRVDQYNFAMQVFFENDLPVLKRMEI